MLKESQFNSKLETDNHHFQQVIIYQLSISLCHSFPFRHPTSNHSAGLLGAVSGLAWQEGLDLLRHSGMVGMTPVAALGNATV